MSADLLVSSYSKRQRHTRELYNMKRGSRNNTSTKPQRAEKHLQAAKKNSSCLAISNIVNPRVLLLKPTKLPTTCYFIHASGSRLIASDWYAFKSHLFPNDNTFPYRRFQAEHFLRLPQLVPNWRFTQRNMLTLTCIQAVSNLQ